MFGRFSGFLCLLVSFAAAIPVSADGSPTLKKRTEWTSSRLHGTPEPPPPYRAEPAFPGLKFTRPLDLCSAPGTGRLFVAEQAGKIDVDHLDDGRGYSIPALPRCFPMWNNSERDFLSNTGFLIRELGVHFGIGKFHEKRTDPFDQVFHQATPFFGRSGVGIAGSSVLRQ